MDRLVSWSGAIMFLIGVAMYFMLTQLGAATFRQDLPPWNWVAFLIAVSGVIVLGVGIVLPHRRIGTLQAEVASKYFVWASVFNTSVAAVLVSPILIPTLEFPILITRWPGIYMVVAYFTFLVVGVLGSFAWSSFLRLEQVVGKRVYRPPFLFHFFALELGVYLIAIFMFLGGYVGSSFNYQGFGDAIVGAGMEFAVIPSALGIFLVALANLVGVGNVLVSRSKVSEQL